MKTPEIRQGIPSQVLTYCSILSSWKQEVGCVTLPCWLSWDLPLAKGHGHNGSHVRLITKDMDRDTQGLAHFSHNAAKKIKCFIRV